MLPLPFAMVGTFGVFFLEGIFFPFSAMIGMIFMVGVVVNDAIVMIQTMIVHRRNGLLGEEIRRIKLMLRRKLYEKKTDSRRGATRKGPLETGPSC